MFEGKLIPFTSTWRYASWITKLSVRYMVNEFLILVPSIIFPNLMLKKNGWLSIGAVELE